MVLGLKAIHQAESLPSVHKASAKALEARGLISCVVNPVVTDLGLNALEALGVPVIRPVAEVSVPQPQGDDVLSTKFKKALASKSTRIDYKRISETDAVYFATCQDTGFTFIEKSYASDKPPMYVECYGPGNVYRSLQSWNPATVRSFIRAMARTGFGQYKFYMSLPGEELIKITGNLRTETPNQ